MANNIEIDLTGTFKLKKSRISKVKHRSGDSRLTERYTIHRDVRHGDKTVLTLEVEDAELNIYTESMVNPHATLELSDAAMDRLVKKLSKDFDIIEK